MKCIYLILASKPDVLFVETVFEKQTFEYIAILGMHVDMLASIPTLYRNWNNLMHLLIPIASLLNILAQAIIEKAG